MTSPMERVVEHAGAQGGRMRRAVAVIALWISAPFGGAAGQEPWPGARCYSVAVGPWRRADSITGSAEQPDPPHLIILDSARRGTPLGWADGPDTIHRVAHGRVRARRAGARAYADYQVDRWFTGWNRPTPDSLKVWFGTGFTIVSFDFREVRERLAGVASWETDYGASASARVTARPARCPDAPPPLGRLRLAAVDVSSPGFHGEPRMPGIQLELTTDRPVPCGTGVDYTLLFRDTLLAWTLHGLYARAEPCLGADRPAVARTGSLKPRRYTVLIGWGADTNRFSLALTDSSVQLTSERATFVTADERLHARWPHNLFILRCGFRHARELCDEVDRWLVGLAGLTRVEPFPHRREINEDVWAELFRYDSPATLARVRACVASIAEQIRATARVHIWIRTWLGEEIVAASAGDQQPSDPIPSSVTTRSACGG